MTTPIRKPHSFSRRLFDLLSSMRFAVSLLVVLGVASVIGTVLRQNEPYNNYRIEFGEFWFRAFDVLGLYNVYHSSWFLLILGFLVLSTALCIWRQTPGMLREMRSFRVKASERSLRLLSHHHESEQSLAREQAEAALQARGYRWKVREDEDGVLIAAKRGSFQRLGYLFAHAAIVVICLGGLLDGNLPLKLAGLAGWKVPEQRSIPEGEVPAISRLSADSPSFRGNVDLAEGATAGVIFLNAGQGYFVQELPFLLKLDRFHIEHYPSGQPKRFASDVQVQDLQGRLIRKGTIEVNKPMIIDGVAIYQSSFGDGGSALSLRRWDLTGDGRAQDVEARSQTEQAIKVGAQEYQIEWLDFRPFNIENMGGQDESSEGLQAKLASARNVQSTKHMQNIGPSIQFKLRDDTGQAIEYQNYMSPWQDGGAWYLLSGVRREVAEPFQFLRVPLDENMQADTFMRLRHMLLDPDQRARVAAITAEVAVAGGGVSESGKAQFEQITALILSQFAKGGFPEIQKFLDQNVPQDQREAVAETYLKVLQGATGEALKLVLQDGGKLLPEQQQQFQSDALVAISNLFDYGRPVYFQLASFNERKSSGFMLTRAPGRDIVYLGSVLLVLGVFCMFYIRERRCWIRLSPKGTLLGMSCNRHDSELDREFSAMKQALFGGEPAGTPQSSEVQS